MKIVQNGFTIEHWCCAQFNVTWKYRVHDASSFFRFVRWQSEHNFLLSVIIPHLWHSIVKHNNAFSGTQWTFLATKGILFGEKCPFSTVFIRFNAMFYSSLNPRRKWSLSGKTTQVSAWWPSSKTNGLHSCELKWRFWLWLSVKWLVIFAIWIITFTNVN